MKVLFLALASIAVCGCHTVANLNVKSARQSENTVEDSSRTLLRKSEGKTLEEAFVARLRLPSRPLLFGPDDPIFLEVAIETGPFELLVPHSIVESEVLLANVLIKDEQGTIVETRKPHAFQNVKRELVRAGRKVECIPGLKLSAYSVRSVILKDLQDNYELKSGNYTLQLLMHLKVYKETLSAESLLIHDAEQRIARVRAKSKIASHTRKKQIAGLERFIKALQQQAEELSEIYLPLDSLRGTTDLQSNVLHFMIEER